MPDRIERFKKRQEVLAAHRASPPLAGLPSAEEVQALAAKEVDQSFIERARAVTNWQPELSVSAGEAGVLLADLEQAFQDARFDEILGRCRKDILAAIAGPFGVGKVLSVYDKVGGNVDTIHNAREGVYATEEARADYEDRGEYNSHDYHAHPDYIAKNRADAIAQDNGELRDAYRDASITAQDRRDQDHIIPAVTVHDDGGRVLARVDGADLANRESNLDSTHFRINRAKGADSPEEFAARLEERRPEYLSRIQELKNKTELSGKEKNELDKLEKLSNVDTEKLREAGAKSREAMDQEINAEYYSSAEFAGDVARTSGAEAAKMGFQQAFGLMLVEMFTALFDEIQDWHGKGGTEDSIFQELKVRLMRVTDRVLAKWEDAVVAFRDGALAGFLSNIVTTLINVFMTTGKRVVRMLREGALSLLRALKAVIFPPEGMSLSDALHEASKIVLAGGIIVGGVVLEEVVDAHVHLIPGVGIFAGIATAVIVGALTAMATAMSVYLLDKLDIFGTNERAKLKDLEGRLDASIQGSLERCEATLLVLESRYEPLLLPST